MKAVSFAFIGLLFLVACKEDTPELIGTQNLQILSVAHADSLLAGSTITLVVDDQTAFGNNTILKIDSPESEFELELSANEHTSGQPISFRVSKELVEKLGVGNHPVDLTLIDDQRKSDSFAHTISLLDTLPISFTGIAGGKDVFHNEPLTLFADNVPLAGEGELQAHFIGQYELDETSEDVDLRLPCFASDPPARVGATVVLSTELGGIDLGTFRGTLTLESTLNGGSSSKSEAADVEFNFRAPQVFEINPDAISLGGIVGVRGAGFVGADDEITIIRATEGTITPLGGEPITIPEPVDLILDFVSGEELRGPILPTLKNDRLIYDRFGIGVGKFEGKAVVVTRKGTKEIVGQSGDVELTLEKIKQVVWVKFLPGFYENLAHFGLGTSAGIIEEIIANRIRGIYAKWNVDVRLKEPQDYHPTSYSTLEIGGADPNNRGIFGVDNTPGIDTGNLRLGDTIGGKNAETLENGNAGFGGVFVQSYFGFSEHSPFPRPQAGPKPDPYFDEIFDPVREQPASQDEVRGLGARAAIVARAITFLGNVVGETAAHEIGHSLGLALSDTHNNSNLPGCLMDHGGARPLTERGAENDAAETKLCGARTIRYMDTILGK